MNLKSTILALLLLVSTTTFWAQEDAVIQNKTGLLIEPENQTGLRDALVSLLSDQVLREKLGKQGMEWAEKHSWEKLTKKLYSS